MASSSRLRRSFPKEVWPVIRQATRDGWTVECVSGGHAFKLVKDRARIPLSGSPKNAIAMRNMLRQAIARAEREMS